MIGMCVKRGVVFKVVFKTATSYQFFIMKVRITEVFLVSVVALLSWFFMFCLECYIGTDYARDIKESKISPPFPDDRTQNLFWFLQVSFILILSILV